MTIVVRMTTITMMKMKRLTRKVRTGDPNYVSLLLCTSTPLGKTWLVWGELNFTYFLLDKYLQN